MNDDPLGLLRKDDPLGLLGAVSEPVAAFKQGSEEQKYPHWTDYMSTTDKLIAGFGKGLMDIPQGAKQRWMEIGNKMGLVGEPDLMRYQKDIQGQEEDVKQLGGWGTAGRTVGQGIVTAPIPGGLAGGMARRLATGAVAGAGVGYSQPTVEGESPELNAVLGGAGGGVGVAGVAGAGKLVNAIRGVPPNPTQALGNKYGIRMTLGEATGSPTKVETWLEQVPIIGIRGFRKKQQAEADRAAKSFFAKYVVDPDAPDIMRANREFAGQYYQRLKSTVDELLPGEKLVFPQETGAAAQSLLKRYPDIFKKFQDTEREGIIKNIIKGIERKRPGMQPSFDEMWTLRDGLGEMIGQARKQYLSGNVDNAQLGQIKHLFASVNKDIDNWANQIGRPEIKDIIRTANDTYKTYVVKYDVLQRAMERAQGAVGGGEMFSPKKFSTALKDIVSKDKYLNRFKPEEIQEMTGLANIMQVVKRGGQFMENPPTANRWGMPLTMGTVGVTAGAAVALPATLVARFLTSTETGKSLALAASKMEPGSLAMKELMKFVQQGVSRLPAIGVTQ